MELILENVRSFVGKHTIPIKPLTLLVGENSSGKTTFLASLAAVSDNIRFPSSPIWNQLPYSLGNYNTITTELGKHENTPYWSVHIKIGVYGSLHRNHLTIKLFSQTGGGVFVANESTVFS